MGISDIYGGTYNGIGEMIMAQPGKIDLVRILKSTEIHKDSLVPELPFTEAIAFAGKIQKSYPHSLSDGDVLRLIYDQVMSALQVKYGPESDSEGKLDTLLAASEIEGMVRNIFQLFKTLPREYEFYFPLPNIEALPAGMTYRLSNNLAIRMMPIVSNSFLKVRTETTKHSPHLKVRVSGYARDSLDSIAGVSALSTLKQGIQMGLLLGLFEKVTVGFFGQGLFGSYHHIPSEKIQIYDVHDKGFIDQDTLVPIDLTYVFHSLRATQKMQGYFKSQQQNIPQLVEYGRFMDLVNNNTNPLKAALEWAFDSGMAVNETISFLQVCIALECVLGRGAPHDNLTATLADRCAYLLGRNLSERNKIRKNFKKLYDIRSSLVHGRARKLTGIDKNFLEWGKVVLDSVIKKEYSLLNV